MIFREANANCATSGLMFDSPFQSSREVYSRKVDYLEMLLDALVRTASSVELVLEKPEGDVEQKKCSKRHKQLWPK